MPSSREKRAQRHQSQSKQNVDRFSGRAKTTQNIPGAGYREVQLIGNKKYYTPLSDDPNQTFGGSTGDTNITVTGGGGSSNHGALSGLNLDSHTQYVLVDGTRAFGGDWTNLGHTIADLGTVTTADIDGGTIDGTVIGSNSQAAGDFTAIGAVSAGTIVGTTIDATTDFTIDGLVLTADNISNDATLNINTDGTTAIAINTSQETTFYADVFIDDGTDTVFHFDQALSQMYIWDDTPNGVSGLYENYVKLQCLTGGVSKLTTLDADGAEADFSLDIDGDIILDSATGIIILEKGGTTYGSFNLDSAGPDIEFVLPSGSLTIDVAGDIILDADGDDIYFENGGAERFRMDLDSTPTLAVTGNFTLDGFGSITLASTTDIALSATGNQVTMDDGSSTYYTFNIDSTPQLDVTGAFTLEGSSTIKMDALGTNFYVDVGSRPKINALSTCIYFNDYDGTFTGATALFEEYAIHNKGANLHFTTGNNDFFENYSLLAYNTTSSSFNNSFGS